MADTTIEELKRAMEYRDGTQCCGSCRHFVPTDCSGDIHAKQSHCVLNPAIDVPVRGMGWCKFFVWKDAG